MTLEVGQFNVSWSGDPRPFWNLHGLGLETCKEHARELAERYHDRVYYISDHEYRIVFGVYWSFDEVVIAPDNRGMLVSRNRTPLVKKIPDKPHIDDFLQIAQDFFAGGYRRKTKQQFRDAKNILFNNLRDLGVDVEAFDWSERS